MDNDFNMHTREQVVNLLNDAFDVYHVGADELWIVLSRITNVRETEAKRINLIEKEHAELEKKYRSDKSGEPQGISEADE